MAAPVQQQSTPGDHQYFDWSTTKQQQHSKLLPIGVNQQHPNLVHNHPLMTHTHHRHHYYEEKCLLEDNKIKLTNETMPTPASNINDNTRKKQKLNGIGSSTNDQNQSQQTCYPFQAELTQKIDIECGSNNNNSGQTAHTPTHHFTLSTVINVSVNGQTPQSQKSSDILSSPSQQQYPQTSNDYPAPTTNLSLLNPFSDLNLSIYLKDLDLTTLDTLMLPLCPNPQDYLTMDGLLTFLMSDNNQKSIEFNKRYQQSLTFRPPSQQMYNYPRTQHYRYPMNNQQYQMSQHFNYAPLQQIMSGTGASLSSIQQPSIQNNHPSLLTTETGNIYPTSYYRQTSLPNYSTSLQQQISSSPAPPFR